MAKFIVISADNRLHYLVDGIEKCLPLNPNVSTGISTGKIIKSDTGYSYKYTIPGRGTTDGAARHFSDLLANQLAAFRLAYCIPNDQLVNIFLLENPLKESDLSASELWIEEFDKVFHDGLGLGTSFCLYRLIFTYSHDTPNDVANQINRDTLKELLDNHIKITHDNTKDTFDRYIFYIDNQKSDDAGMCLDKEDHDLKMPRFLADFMMLASNNDDRSKVVSAINPATGNTRIFSVGFAESMYYYPDVERYYKHADNRDLHRKFLLDEDETHGDTKKEAMDAEKHPFGLRKRNQVLAKYYEDVPLDEDLNNYPESSDKKINDCLVALKDILTQERDKEQENFNNSPDVVTLENAISECEEKISSAKSEAGETKEDFEERIAKLHSEKEQKTNELNVLKDSFEPECPLYVDRGMIYTDLCVTQNNNEPEKIAEYSARYNKLVDFVTKSEKFLVFAKSTAPAVTALPSDEPEKSKDSNPGCLTLVVSGFKRLLGLDTKPSQGGDENDSNNGSTAVKTPPTDYITQITEQLKLKSAYVTFKNYVDAIEKIYASEKEECDNFKLTIHTNHYCTLIDLGKLKEAQSETSSERLEKIILDWRDEAKPTKSGLVSLTQIESAKYTKKEFPFIDWVKPFSFVKDISNDDRMAKICDTLQKMAAPFVNYNLPDTKYGETKMNRLIFSDRPNFAEEFQKIRTKVDKGTEMLASTSVHVASKICMMEILPLDEKILSNLADLQEDGNTVIADILAGLNAGIGNSEDGNNATEPPVLDWGND